MATRQSLPERDRRSPLDLHVVAGLHTGARCTIPMSGSWIGASDDDDVLLADEGVQARHVSVRVYGARVAVEAAGGDVEINGALLRQGTGLHTRLPVTLSIGTARVAFASRQNDKPVVRLFKPFMNIRSVAGVTTVALVIGFCGMFDAGSAVASMFRFTPSHAVSGSDGAVDRDSTTPEIDRPDAVEALRQHVAAAGLDSIEVAPGTDVSDIRARGTFAPDAKEQWTSVQRWFDSHYGRRFVLVNSVAPGRAPKSPDIRFDAVWLGQHPYVVDADGQRHYPGSNVGHGWWLKSIDTKRVVLRRGDRTFELSL